MTPEDSNVSLRFSDAAVSLMLGRAIAEGLSDVVRQPLPPAIVDRLNELDHAPGHGTAGAAGCCTHPTDERDG